MALAAQNNTSTALTISRPQSSIVMPDSSQFEMIQRMAHVVSASSLTKTKLSQADATLIMLKGWGLGIDPLESISQIYIVDGVPSISAQMMIALANRSNLLKMFSIPDTADVKKAGSATVKAVRRDREDVYSGTFSIDDAKKAGLANKRNWQNYPEQMLIARAISICVRKAVPEALSGMYLVEEINPSQTVDEAGTPITVSDPNPQKTEPKQQAPAQPDPPVQEAELVEDEPETQPEPAEQGETVPADHEWATQETISKFYDYVVVALNDKELTKGDIAKLAGIDRFTDLDAWNETFATGKDAGAAIKAKFDEETQAPPAKAKSETKTEAKEEPVEDTSTYAEPDPENPNDNESFMPTTIRYVKHGKNGKKIVMTNIDGVTKTLYSRQVFRDVDDGWAEYAEGWEVDGVYTPIEDGLPMLNIVFKKGTNEVFRANTDLPF